MAQVLVTGANGFLGSWVTAALVNEGHKVKILARPQSDLSELDISKIEVVNGDILDRESVDSACKSQDAVFHLAGVIAYTPQKRELMEKVNVGGTKNVVEAVKRHQVRRLVHLSSVVAIGAGRDKSDVLNEKSQYNIKDLDLGYFETKRKSEALVKEACDKKEIDAVILNPSTIYGAGDARKASRTNQMKAAKGQLRFCPPGGVNVVAVEDVVTGILAAWKNGKTGERYILASDNLLIYDVMNMIAKEAHSRPPDVIVPKIVMLALGKIGDQIETLGHRSFLNSELANSTTLYNWFDNSKAKAELGLQFRSSQEAIHNSVQWIKDRGLLS